ncbi:MAG: hypothetical protein K2G38_04355, partial [Clostridia bacterium]|nr:hypothetical protein [Clostridia bacterium]
TGSITGGASDKDADLISPVERCWVHHNTFLPGYCSQPAESDKADGDGSCDFKRGQFYTLSYNHFSNCHKTNLIGSSDTTQTFNVTIHHNWYETVKARQPLARRANIHYYNNYVSDATDYVTSFRGSCLVFSEANYYDGCKQVTQKKDGVGVAWNNIYNSCYNENDYTELKSRTETVPNDCKFIFRNIDYTQFYINSEQFYYDSVNKVSNCLLDDAVGARIRVLMQAGANGSQIDAKDTAFNQYTPASAVVVGNSGLSINFKDTSKISKGSSVVSNVVLNGITGVDSKTGIKGKGQIITFTITAPTEVKVEGTAGSEDMYPQIFDSYGKAWQTKFNGEVTVVLPAGTYVICSGQKDKEAIVSSISFADTEASSVARVNAAQVALAAVPEEIGYNSYSLIETARKAYSALLSNEIEQIDSALVTRLGKAEKAYESLAVSRVIARINYIGTVDETSYNKINAARKEYNALNAEQQKEVTNYATLTAAETAFAQFAAKNVTDLINDLPDLTKATISTEETLAKVENWLDTVNKAYEALTEEQQAQVVGYDKIAAGYAELKKFENMINFRAALAETEVATLTINQGAALKSLYAKLTDAQKEMLTFAENKKYEEIATKHTEMASQAVECTFIDGKPSSSLFVSTGAKQSAKKTKFTVHAYNEDEQLASGLKFEGTTEITITVESKMTLTLYLYNDCAMSIDGTSYDVVTLDSGDKVVTVTLEKGSHKMTRAKSENSLYYATLTPAS